MVRKFRRTELQVWQSCCRSATGAVGAVVDGCSPSSKTIARSESQYRSTDHEFQVQISCGSTYMCQSAIQDIESGVSSSKQESQLYQCVLLHQRLLNNDRFLGRGRCRRQKLWPVVWTEKVRMYRLASKKVSLTFAC
jgi:hypothetical protein